MKATSPSPSPEFITHSLVCTFHFANAGLVNFKAAADACGRAFYYLIGAGALLELALVQFVMGRLVAAGFTPVLPPDIARENTVANCGFQPRGEETQVFRLDEHHADGLGHLCLVGTSEIPLAALDAGQVRGTSCSKLNQSEICVCKIFDVYF